MGAEAVSEGEQFVYGSVVHRMKPQWEVNGQ